MDHQYGIHVTNKFSLFLDEDEDPLEKLSSLELAAKSKKKDDGDKKGSKSKQKKAPATELKSKTPEQPSFKKDEKPSGPRQNDRGGRGRREPREIRDNDGDRRPQWRQGQKDNRDGNLGGDRRPQWRQGQKDNRDGNQGRLETMTETEDLNGVKDKRTTVTEILEETKMYHQSSGSDRMDNSVEMVKGDAAVVEAGVEDEVETEGVSLVDNLVDSEIVDGSLIAIVLLTGRV